jgi:glycosyltransferase involved in cell wall biosynthesis
MMEPRLTGSAAGELHVAYPARAYAHKNFSIVGPAGDIYAKRSGKRLVVHVTLREEEWRHLPEHARQWVRNHGEANVQQVLDIYRQVDAVFFPSLLETSSATPLEANVLGIPLIASDRSFVRASSQAFALFEPRDPDSIADSLCRFDAARAEAWEQARSIAIAYRQALSAGSRTERYLDMISGELQRLQGEKPRSG